MAIPKTMQAAVVEQFGKPLVMQEVPVPTPGPGQALVEIIATGVCHIDLHAADGDWPAKPTPPFIPGHEGAGIVAALGLVMSAPSLRSACCVAVAPACSTASLRESFPSPSSMWF